MQRKTQQKRLIKKLYRMQNDLMELKEYYQDEEAETRLIRRIERMQFRVVYFIERLLFD